MQCIKIRSWSQKITQKFSSIIHEYDYVNSNENVKKNKI